MNETLSVEALRMHSSPESIRAGRMEKTAMHMSCKMRRAWALHKVQTSRPFILPSKANVNTLGGAKRSAGREISVGHRLCQNKIYTVGLARPRIVVRYDMTRADEEGET